MLDPVEAISTGAEIDPPIDPDQRRASIALRCAPCEIATARQAEAERLRHVVTTPLPLPDVVDPVVPGTKYVPWTADIRSLEEPPKSGQRKIDDAVIQQMRECRQQGLLLAKIAERFGVSTSSVHRALQREAT